MTSLREFSHKLSPKKWKWIGIGLVAVAAMQVYYVQEMIAALIIFSVLFFAGAVVVLIIFLLDRASQQITAWAEPGAARVVHWVADAVEAIVARPVWAQAVSHRLHKGQLKQNEKN